MGRLKDKLHDWLFEKVPEENKELISFNKKQNNSFEEKEEIVEEQLIVEKPIIEKKEEIIVEKENEQIKKDNSPFLKIKDDNVKEPIKEEEILIKEEKKENEYVSYPVISPIFGIKDEVKYNYSNPKISLDDERTTYKSVLGTVFSPINGQEIVYEDAYDEVDEKIANMTPDDFIASNETEEKIEKQETEEEVNEFIEIQQPQTKETCDLMPIKKIVNPHEVVISEPVIKPAAVASPFIDISLKYENYTEDNDHNLLAQLAEETMNNDKDSSNDNSYENLSLFD